MWSFEEISVQLPRYFSADNAPYYMRGFYFAFLHPMLLFSLNEIKAIFIAFKILYKKRWTQIKAVLFQITILVNIFFSFDCAIILYLTEKKDREW